MDIKRLMSGISQEAYSNGITLLSSSFCSCSFYSDADNNPVFLFGFNEDFVSVTLDPNLSEIISIAFNSEDTISGDAINEATDSNKFISAAIFVLSSHLDALSAKLEANDTDDMMQTINSMFTDDRIDMVTVSIILAMLTKSCSVSRLSLDDKAVESMKEYCNHSEFAIFTLFIILLKYDKKYTVNIFCTDLKQVLSNYDNILLFSFLAYTAEVFVQHEGTEAIQSDMNYMMVYLSNSANFRKCFSETTAYKAASLLFV